jgi:hypothetical protein
VLARLPARSTRLAHKVIHRIGGQQLPWPGIAPEAAASLELDHRLSLPVGGHPRHLANQQLQALEGEGEPRSLTPGFYRLCSGCGPSAALD